MQLFLTANNCLTHIYTFIRQDVNIKKIFSVSVYFLRDWGINE